MAIFILPSNKQVLDLSKPCKVPVVESSLDKLSITLHVNTDDEQFHIVQSLLKLSQTPKVSTYPTSWNTRYQARFRYYAGESSILIEAFPRKINEAFLRIEMNPAQLGSVGIDEFKQLMNQLCYGGYSYCAKTARVTRFDVAIDCIGMNINDVYFLPNKIVKSNIWLGTDGRIETLNLGSTKSKRFLRIYDKRKEIQSKMGKVIGPEVTRVERVIKTGVMFQKLSVFPNPLDGLNLIGMNFECPEVPKDTLKLFKGLARTQGIGSALGKLSIHNRSKVRAAMKANAYKWWDSKKIWGNWCDNLASSGLYQYTDGSPI